LFAFGNLFHTAPVSVIAQQVSSDAEKLATLRHLDPFRVWRSLDDERRCLSCGRIISGREIRFVGGTPETGEVCAICPTENCKAVALDWAVPM
jgi:hypothetical protein